MTLNRREYQPIGKRIEPTMFDKSWADLHEDKQYLKLCARVPYDLTRIGGFAYFMAPVLAYVYYQFAVQFAEDNSSWIISKPFLGSSLVAENSYFLNYTLALVMGMKLSTQIFSVSANLTDTNWRNKNLTSGSLLGSTGFLAFSATCAVLSAIAVTDMAETVLIPSYALFFANRLIIGQGAGQNFLKNFLSPKWDPDNSNEQKMSDRSLIVKRLLLAGLSGLGFWCNFQFFLACLENCQSKNWNGAPSYAMAVSATSAVAFLAGNSLYFFGLGTKKGVSKLYHSNMNLCMKILVAFMAGAVSLIALASGIPALQMARDKNLGLPTQLASLIGAAGPNGKYVFTLLTMAFNLAMMFSKLYKSCCGTTYTGGRSMRRDSLGIQTSA